MAWVRPKMALPLRVEAGIEASPSIICLCTTDSSSRAALVPARRAALADKPSAKKAFSSSAMRSAAGVGPFPLRRNFPVAPSVLKTASLPPTRSASNIEALRMSSGVCL